MNDVLHLIQDLRAEAPAAAPEHAVLMRRAADRLDRHRHLLALADLEPPATRGVPIPPPNAEAHDETRPRAGRNHRAVKGATVA